MFLVCDDVNYLSIHQSFSKAPVYSASFCIRQGLNFRAEWWDSHPKFRNPIEKKLEGRRILWFHEIFLL